LITEYIEAALKRAKYEIIEDKEPYYGEVAEFDGRSMSAWPLPQGIAGHGARELARTCNLGYRAKHLVKLARRIERAEEKLRELEAEALDMHPSDYIEKRTNWEAMIMCGRAIIRYAERHAHLARHAKKEKDRLKECGEVIKEILNNEGDNDSPHREILFHCLLHFEESFQNRVIY
jgi:hypothetical protein